MDVCCLIEKDSHVAAKTSDGTVYIWPFISDVHTVRRSTSATSIVFHTVAALARALRRVVDAAVLMDACTADRPAETNHRADDQPDSRSEVSRLGFPVGRTVIGWPRRKPEGRRSPVWPNGLSGHQSYTFSPALESAPAPVRSTRRFRGRPSPHTSRIRSLADCTTTTPESEFSVYTEEL
jgi:hypothetical protein